MSWAAKKEYVQTKYQRADKRMYELNRDLAVAFWILGLRTNQSKTFKNHQEGTEAAICYGHKEYFIRNKG